MAHFEPSVRPYTTPHVTNLGIIAQNLVKLASSQRSSVVEQSFHKTEVTGPNPVAGTRKTGFPTFSSLEGEGCLLQLAF